MSTNFITNVALGLAGAAVVVASQAFGSSVTAWATFGVSLGVLALLGVAQLDRGRGLAQRGLDGATGALAVWSAVASVVFKGDTVTWLSFGEALGFVGLALIGLVAHELDNAHALGTISSARADPMGHRRGEELPTAA